MFSVAKFKICAAAAGRDKHEQDEQRFNSVHLEPSAEAAFRARQSRKASGRKLQTQTFI